MYATAENIATAAPIIEETYRITNGESYARWMFETVDNNIHLGDEDAFELARNFLWDAFPGGTTATRVTGRIFYALDLPFDLADLI